jgi:hypothetical protein
MKELIEGGTKIADAITVLQEAGLLIWRNFEDQAVAALSMVVASRRALCALYSGGEGQGDRCGVLRRDGGARPQGHLQPSGLEQREEEAGHCSEKGDRHLVEEEEDGVTIIFFPTTPMFTRLRARDLSHKRAGCRAAPLSSLPEKAKHSPPISRKPRQSRLSGRKSKTHFL